MACPSLHDEGSGKISPGPSSISFPLSAHQLRWISLKSLSAPGNFQYHDLILCISLCLEPHSLTHSIANSQLKFPAPPPPSPASKFTLILRGGYSPVKVVPNPCARPWWLWDSQPRYIFSIMRQDPIWCAHGGSLTLGTHLAHCTGSMSSFWINGLV